MNTLPFLSHFEWLSYGFMQHAFLALLLAAPLFGALGSMVVAGRMAFFSDALGHGAFTGIAIGAVSGLALRPTLAAILFSVLFAFLITVVKRKSNASSDTVIGVFSSTAAAVGLVILSRYNRLSQYSSTLTGDILSVSSSDLWYLLVLFVIISIGWFFISNKLFLLNLDLGLAKSMNINPFLTEVIFTMLLAGLVSASISWIGLLLINSFLVLPAATARLFARNLLHYYIASVIIAFTCAMSGLVLSFYLNVATGATIVLLCALCYFVTLLCKIILRKNI